MNSRILPSLALLVAVGIFFVYVQPTWSGPIAAMKAAIENDNQALTAAAEYVTQQNALASARNALNPNDLKRLAIFLPDSVDNVGVILDLNALAAKNGLSLSNIDVAAGSGSPSANQNTRDAKPVSEPAKGPATSVDLSLSAIGTYSSLQSFLRGIEKSQRLLDVRDLVVTGSDTGVYTYKMKLRLYWLH